jgi:hypothetical protein
VDPRRKIREPRQYDEQDRDGDLDPAMYRKRHGLQCSKRKSRDDRQQKVHDRERVADRRLLSMKSGDRRTDYEDQHHRVIDDAVGNRTDGSEHVQLLPRRHPEVAKSFRA